MRRFATPLLATVLLATVLLASTGCVVGQPVEAARSPREEIYFKFAATDDFEGQWRAAMIAAEIGDKHNEPSQSRRLDFSKRGLANADRAIRVHDECVEGHYYRALCIGRILDNESLPTLSYVKELEKEGLATVARDPRFECAGGHRLLAILYATAPSIGGEWAVGDDEKAEDHFQQALVFGADCPENPIEYVKWHLKQGSIDPDVGLEMIKKARLLIDPHKMIGPESKLRLHQQCLELEKQLLALKN